MQLFKKPRPPEMPMQLSGVAAQTLGAGHSGYPIVLQPVRKEQAAVVDVTQSTLRVQPRSRQGPTLGPPHTISQKPVRDCTKSHPLALAVEARGSTNGPLRGHRRFREDCLSIYN